MRVLTTFAEVAIRMEKKTKCTNCKKRLVRRKKFWQTLSPFNKNILGWPKTREEINVELSDEVSLWRVQPELCRSCGDASADAEGERQAAEGINK